jgi:hypothetical protein
MFMIKRLILLSTLIVAIVAPPVWAQKAAPYEATQPYLDVQNFPPELLPVPPQEGTQAHRWQVEAVLTAQQQITAEDKIVMVDEQHLRLELLTDALADDVVRATHPAIFHLLDRVWADTRGITDQAKKFWQTRRPYLVDSRVKLGVDPIDSSPAYPSGHTCGSMVAAEVLGLIFPKQRATLYAKAESIARNRVLAGVHYPNDLDGGRLLAMQIIGALMQNEGFRDDLKAAKIEAGSP